ncbi:hypothetical protein NPIL_196521 [Nephila pilipes]|uniref:MATH domain-containing protein n=1 Tax=Nephila pilipes TaxID=299642 RepID=A0A8X6NN10_NEPPI|nr:hypothetical protein NPIL_196521 [Nephila pilipes]
MEDLIALPVEYSLVWKIENFRYASHKTGEKLVSPVFVTHNISWTLELYPRGIENNKYLSCFLTRADDNSDFEREVNYKIHATHNSGSNAFDSKSRVLFKCGHTDGFAHFMERDCFKFENLPYHQDCLTLNCKIHFEVYNFNFVGESFATTHIRIQNIHFTFHFKVDSNNFSGTVNVENMIDSKLLLGIHIRQLSINELIINLKPVYGECFKYYICMLTIKNLTKWSESWKYFTEERDPFLEKTLKMTESSSFENCSFRLRMILFFSTGEEHKGSERIISQTKIIEAST